MELQEIEGMDGAFKVEPVKIMYHFWSNSNYMYCQDFKTKKIIKVKKYKISIDN